MNALQRIPQQNALAQVKPKALEIMASRLAVDPAKMLDALKSTVFKNATNEELIALVVVANEFGLNPFLRELYAFPAKGGGICPVVSVDGWNKMMIRQESFDGIEFTFMDKEDGTPYSCTSVIYVKGRSKPVSVTEYFDECFRKTEPWLTMPRRMLRHKALVQGARLAFGFSGVTDEDEAIDITGVVAVDASMTPPPHSAPTPQITEGHGFDPQVELSTVILEAGFTLDDFRAWADQSGNIVDAHSLSGFGDIKAADAKRLLNAKRGLLAGLAKIKAPVTPEPAA